MDRPGAVYGELGPDEWPSLHENSRHTFSVRLLDEDERRFRTISFAPTFMAFSVEWIRGVEAQRLAENADFLRLLKAFDSIKAIAKIRDVKRAGLRIYEFDRLGAKETHSNADDESEDTPHKLLNQFIEQSGGTPISASITRHAGQSFDVMWRQVGRHEDGTRYMVSAGPFRDDEKSKYFEELHKNWDESLNCDFVADSDFSDHDFESTVSAKSWATPLIDRYAKMISEVKGTIRGSQ
ncbi:hypothetical protein [Xanthomonas campestris]|uniref:hypothetical protein n=1 Tax=Xanthomonas campestris TaxID=339 RepID=UPI003CF8200A